MKKNKFGSSILLGTLVIGCSEPKTESKLLINHVGFPEKGEKDYFSNHLRKCT